MNLELRYNIQIISLLLFLMAMMLIRHNLISSNKPISRLVLPFNIVFRQDGLPETVIHGRETSSIGCPVMLYTQPCRQVLRWKSGSKTWTLTHLDSSGRCSSDIRRLNLGTAAKGWHYFGSTGMWGKWQPPVGQASSELSLLSSQHTPSSQSPSYTSPI